MSGQTSRFNIGEANLTRESGDFKGNNPVEIFLKKKPEVLKRITAQAKKPLRDAAAVNATRYAIGRMLKEFSLSVSFWSGGRTKYNRSKQGYRKDHWIDAACTGEKGIDVFIPESLSPLVVKAQWHGSRQVCRVDRYGFPRTSAKSRRVVKGFRTGDIIRAIVTKGNKTGKYTGRVVVRATGSFNIKTNTETVQGIGWKYCSMLHRADGYHYATADSSVA